MLKLKDEETSSKKEKISNEEKVKKELSKELNKTKKAMKEKEKEIIKLK